MRIVSMITAVVISWLAVATGQSKPQAEWLVLKVTPRAILQGGAVRLECRIPRHPDNRVVELGIVGVRTSAKTLDGDRAPVLHSLVIENVPCEGTEAYCHLVRTNNTRLAKVKLLVGCD